MKLRFLLLASLCTLLCACGAKSPVPSSDDPTPTLTPTPVEPTPSFSFSVNLADRHQVIDGFGAGFTWYAEQATEHLHRDTVYDLLFKDAGLTILRFKNEYGYPKTFDNSIACNVAFYNAAKERAEKRGEDVTVLYTSWSPTADLKSNNSINGGGTLRRKEDGTYDYEAFARWWVDSVKAYREAGIPVDVLSIQNECDFVASYDGCEFGMRENDTKASYAKAFLACYKALVEEFGDEVPKMIAPETMTCVYSSLMAYVSDILDEAPESIFALGHHLYLGGNSSDKPDYCGYDSFNQNLKGIRDFAKKHDFHAWQTEFYRGTTLQTANIINNSLVYEDANAYIFWGGVWMSKYGDNLETNNLICIARGMGEWINKDGYLVTGDYYALRHFSEYIRPGYVRVESTLNHLTDEEKTDVRLSTFQSPDGKRLVTVLINNGATEQYVNLTTPGYTGSSKVIRSVFSDKFTTDMMYNDLGALPESNVLLLPPASVTTVLLD